MKKKIYFLLIIVSITLSVNCQSIEWLTEIKGYRMEEVKKMHITPQEDIILTGYTSWTESYFGGITVPLNNSVLENFFIAKCDKNGVF